MKVERTRQDGNAHSISDMFQRQCFVQPLAGLIRRRRPRSSSCFSALLRRRGVDARPDLLEGLTLPRSHNGRTQGARAARVYCQKRTRPRRSRLSRFSWTLR